MKLVICKVDPITCSRTRASHLNASTTNNAPRKARNDVIPDKNLNVMIYTHSNISVVTYVSHHDAYFSPHKHERKHETMTGMVAKTICALSKH